MINRVKIRIIGKNHNYFLKEIIRRKINIYEIDNNDIIIDYEDYIKLKEIKTTYKIKVIRKYGYCRYLELLKKYIYLIIFTIVGIIINIILSNIIFDIKVDHPNKELVKTIIKDLESLGLKKYHLKVNYQRKEEIKEKLLEKEKDKIEWLEINNVGTKYIVKVEEKKKYKKEICNDRSIISKKEAIILEINSSSGEIVKKKNDYVEKGEIIVSGLIHNKDKVVSKKCAIATIYGETWYNVKVSIPKNYQEIEKLNKNNYSININIFNKKIDLFTKPSTMKNEDYNIVESNIIPINISIINNQKIKVIKKLYNTNNIDNEAIIIASKELKKKLSKDEKILSKKVLKKSEKNSKIEVEVFFKITDYLDISNINIEELNTVRE